MPSPILLFETDDDLRAVLADMLRGEGLDVDEAMTLAAAEQALRAREYAVLLVDKTLYSADAEQLLENLADRDGSPSTIIVSATPNLGSVVADTYGVEFVSIPFSFRYLLMRIEEHQRKPRKPSHRPPPMGA
jgi:DNA-binding response OmpR family regulator